MAPAAARASGRDWPAGPPYPAPWDPLWEREAPVSYSLLTYAAKAALSSKWR